MATATLWAFLAEIVRNFIFHWGLIMQKQAHRFVEEEQTRQFASDDEVDCKDDNFKKIDEGGIDTS